MAVSSGLQKEAEIVSFETPELTGFVGYLHMDAQSSQKDNPGTCVGHLLRWNQEEVEALPMKVPAMLEIKCVGGELNPVRIKEDKAEMCNSTF